MSRMKSESGSRTYAPPPPVPPTDILRRRIVAGVAIVLLYTAAIPFSPVSWILGGLSGASVVDRLAAGVVLLCALYFQFTIAAQTYPVVVTIPNPMQQGQSIQNGRLSRSSDSDLTFFYHPSNYWTYIFAELALLAIAEFGPFEYLRRIIVVGVMAALWAVGWTITPQRTKTWAWEHIKRFWFWIALDIMAGAVGNSYNRRRRR